MIKEVYMKRTLVSIILFLIVIASVIAGAVMKRNNDNSNLTKVKVAEVAHSIFYAPQYAAISNGYFEEEGLDIELILTPGADAVMSSVLSGDVNIGFSGTEATIYVYNGGEEDYPVTFAALTKRDGAFLVSREKIDNFTLNDLKGKSVIGGAGDFVTLFEPNATSVEKEGLGYIVAYVGELGGAVPYTAYNAKRSYIDNNPDIIKGFSRAINKGLKFVSDNDAETIAKSIISFFPDTALNDLITMIDRYKKGDAYRETISINEEEWKHIQDIMIAAGELDEYAPYDKLIYGKYFNEFE